MSESEICSSSAGIVLLITVFNLLILALNLNLYGYRKKKEIEQAKGKAYNSIYCPWGRRLTTCGLSSPQNNTKEREGVVCTYCQRYLDKEREERKVKTRNE